MLRSPAGLHAARGSAGDLGVAAVVVSRPRGPRTLHSLVVVPDSLDPHALQGGGPAWPGCLLAWRGVVPTWQGVGGSLACLAGLKLHGEGGSALLT